MTEELCLLFVTTNIHYKAHSHHYLLFINICHSQGGERMMDLLHNQIQTLQPNESKSVFFLNSCHQHPFYTFIHDPDVKMGFFDCTPQLRSLETIRTIDDKNEHNKNISKPSYHDSWRQRFWDNPMKILDQVFPSSKSHDRSTFDAYINPRDQQTVDRHPKLWFAGRQSPAVRPSAWFGGLGSPVVEMGE